MSFEVLRKIRFYWAAGALVVSLATPQAFSGTLTLGTISGVSNQDIADLTKPIIYGGFTGGCTSDGGSNTTPCDSCAVAPATGGPVICNFTNAYPSLIVTFSLSTTTSGFVATDFRATSGSTTKTTFDNPATLDAGGALTAYMTWAEICTLLGNNNNCDDDVSGEITLSLKNSANEDTIVVSVHIRHETAANDYYTDCDDGTVTGSPGVCHFEAFRGDGKIYAKDLVYSDGYPTTSVVSGIPYAGLVFFYAEDATGGVSDSTLIGQISSRSSYKSIGVNSSSSKLADNRITGLSNDTRYCVLAGNQDKAGVISGFTPLSVNSDWLCQTPTLVVGLLDDKKCFIATAAFGSSMAPEVESFRQFRNNFLLTNTIGKTFVRLYYQHSPYFANLIAQSEVAKAVVRAALWPILIFARVALVFGFWMTLLLTALGGFGIYEVYRRFFVLRRFRGEL